MTEDVVDYPEDVGWTPRRAGPIYCSPRCGAGCKWIAYRKACQDAALAAVDLGQGWAPQVWENLGWHWQVVNSGCEISPSGNAFWGSLCVGTIQFTIIKPSLRMVRGDLINQLNNHILQAKFKLDILTISPWSSR